jgi:predicted nucleic acid-binding protein
MTIRSERWLLDTNVWVFGLRRDKTYPACAQLLQRLGSFSVVIPLQVLKELNLTLTETEMNDFYRLINQNPDLIELSWQPASLELVTFYQGRGCRKGDAVIAAHAEALEIKTIVSENRQFLQTLREISTELITASEADSRLASS